MNERIADKYNRLKKRDHKLGRLIMLAGVVLASIVIYQTTDAEAGDEIYSHFEASKRQAKALERIARALEGRCK